jgi:hypothetical protein
MAQPEPLSLTLNLLFCSLILPVVKGQRVS